MTKARPHVDVLTFTGCPNAEPAVRLVERIGAELGIDADLHQVLVQDAEQAKALRFLGSPSIRVDGRDVEPGAEARDDYVLSCRVYSTESGLQGQPDERWLRAALRESA